MTKTSAVRFLGLAMVEILPCRAVLEALYEAQGHPIQVLAQVV
ncbi:MAG: hypothetical protein ACE5JU_13450 [Candidatus Binatia bacterium]